MEFILNYIKINDMIHTSGQPTQKEFEEIANNDFDIVINLSLATSEGKIENEDDVVSELGMNYFHIPVDFENPTEENLRMFIQLLSSLENRKVWVHCIMNYRVSAFMYVYHKYILRTPFDQIDLSMFDEWSPSEKWQEIMKIEF